MALLELSKLSKRFGGLAAVDGCSFAVSEGSVTGLIGPNGAGKSTLFDLISGVLAPDAGEIVFHGERIAGLAPERIARRGLGRTFQTPRLFLELSAWENLMVAGPAQPGERLGAALWGSLRAWRRERELSARAQRLLDFLGLAPLGDEPASSLSGGQRKLLELGRVLMMEPKLVLLDEPAAGVNQTLARTLFERIAQVRDEGITFLIIEHDMDLVMRACERIVVMHNGRTLAQGTPAQIRADPAVLDAYLGGQFV